VEERGVCEETGCSTHLCIVFQDLVHICRLIQRVIVLFVKGNWRLECGVFSGEGFVPNLKNER
jgi:hypothetical protein